ncbi:tripartite tricarboxylate transporter substrate binding protein [Cupriavidus gilardii]|uniref:Bug family tripartite tricarboxylate transporter substrate binding protein n=1 Tax=Cupriavidus gilardii TaxID=82541 RepID=UPI0021C0141F|nr:tripartite tricarboxylate transporter substrate binding protein [Cupriavidus gilardii]MCT9074894.1 tripartite tricarboxylate transporter substrate binding protein [Cupriavidus gilardii]
MTKPTSAIRRAVLICSLALPSILHAQQSSTVPVRIYVGYGPGGGTDVVARAVGEELSKIWNRPVIVENRPGANGAIASKAVARAEPDGSSLLVMPPTSLIIDAALRPNIAVDPGKELTLVSGLVTTPLVVVTPASAPYNNLADLIKAAHAANGKFSYGWGNLGMRVGMEELSQKTGVKMTPIGYKSAGQSVPAIVSGEIDMLMIDMAPIAQLVKAGKVKALAVSTPERSPMLPNVPTFKESGVDVQLTGSIALYAPAKVSQTVIKKMRSDVASVLKNTELRSRITGTGMDVYDGSQEYFEAYLMQRKNSIEAVIKAGDFKLE